MAIVANSSGKTNNPVIAGVHVVTCVRVVDLGTQFSPMFGNSQHKIMITWEVPDDTIIVEDKEMPKLISKEYTLSLGEKATLRSHLESWRGKKFTDEELNGFDLMNVLSVPCQIQVLHNDKGYANISSIMAMPKGMTPPEQIHESIYFDMSTDECLPLLDKLPDWVKDKVKASPEYQALAYAQSDNTEAFTEVDDTQLPF